MQLGGVPRNTFLGTSSLGSEEGQKSRKVNKMCGAAKGFLGPTLDPFIWIWSIWRWLRLSEDGKLSGVDRNTNDGVETRLNKLRGLPREDKT